MNDVAQVRAVVLDFAKERAIDPERIVPSASLADLGIDSLQAIDLAFRFEERFGIAVPLERFNAKTVGEATEYVVELLRERRRREN